MAEIFRHPEHHNPSNIGVIGAPHGPDTGDDHESFRGQYDPNASADVLKPHLFPSDMYTSEGVYFGDLPYGQMASFVTKVDVEEVKKEASSVWKMFKHDPLSPVSWYFKNAVLPGAGLGLEG